MQKNIDEGASFIFWTGYTFGILTGVCVGFALC